MAKREGRAADGPRAARRVRGGSHGALAGSGRGASRTRSDVRTPKSAATREKIMAAACDLMVERGSTDFQMSEISERCEMSKGSLYYYFSDKAALVRAVFDRSVDKLVANVESVVAKAPSATESILRLVTSLAEAVQPKGPLALAMTHSGSEERGGMIPDVEPHVARIISILTAQIERAKGEGIVREECESRLAAVGITGAFVIFEYAMPGFDGDDLESAVRKVLDIAFTGVGTERGRTIFSLSQDAPAAGAGQGSDTTRKDG